MSTLTGMRTLADQANALGRYEAVIHAVAIGYRKRRSITTADGLSQLWAVKVLAPYVLTALVERPARLVYLSSELHRRVEGTLDDPQLERRPWCGTRAYSETRFQDALLAMAFARLWPDVLSNAVEPGWVATRMGGPGATSGLAAGAVTEARLAVCNDAEATLTGRCFHHRRPARLHPAATDAASQDELIARCARLSGVPLVRSQ